MTLRQLATVALTLVAACTQLPQEPVTQPSAPALPPPTAAPATPPAAAPAPAAPARAQTGRVSFYAMRFEGRKTASGEIFDPEALTMAHRSLPFGTRVRVTNLANQRSVEVVVNDRGPMIQGRIADLSPAAARAIGLTADGGTTEARIEVLPPQD